MTFKEWDFKGGSRDEFEGDLKGDLNSLEIDTEVEAFLCYGNTPIPCCIVQFFSNQLK